MFVVLSVVSADWLLVEHHPDVCHGLPEPASVK